MTLSYITGELHSESFEQINRLAQELGYSVRVYESRDSSQFDFLQAVYRDTATIVDATIPDDLTLSTVYPILTAQINCVDHILVFSDNYYEDNTQILPLNITPLRVRRNLDRDVVKWLRTQLEDLKTNVYYERFEIDSIETLLNYKERMERVISISLDLHKPLKGDKTRVMISYRSSCSKEVELLRKQEEEKGGVEIKVLPPGSLCDDHEALSPMRRWMLVGLLDDYIRNVDELWIYYNDIYTKSWWTLAELIMVAYVNYGMSEESKIKVKIYDATKKRFLDKEEEDYHAFLHVSLTNIQHKKLARLMSNTRPDSMGPESNDNIKKVKWMAFVMRFFTKKKRVAIAEQIRPMIEQGLPSDLPQEDREKMVNDLLAMYSDPKAILKYVNDDVFKKEFWNNISYQTDDATAAYNGKDIDVDTFINTPMQELTKFKDENLRSAADNKLHIKLKGMKYHVSEGKKRYLWLATRMGIPTVKDAPGIEIVQTYNLKKYE